MRTLLHADRDSCETEAPPGTQTSPHAALVDSRRPAGGLNLDTCCVGWGNMQAMGLFISLAYVLQKSCKTLFVSLIYFGLFAAFFGHQKCNFPFFTIIRF